MVIMDLLSGVSADNLFISSNYQQGLENLANTALSQGIDHYQKKEYDKAAAAFERSLRLAPASSLASDTANYLSSAWQKLGENEKAIAVYRDAIKRNPTRDDTQVKLGNILFSLGRAGEAVEAYQKAVAINPSSTNLYSLSEGLLSAERSGEAADVFRRVQYMEPAKTNGYYGLGRALSKMGDKGAAIEQFEKAIALKADFYSGYAELGYTYADMGQTDDAQRIFEFLEEKDPNLADTLNRYMYKTAAPRFSFASTESSFNYRLTIKTPVAALDAYLENANASRSFTMIFQFDKEMDRASVENRFNWRLSRSAHTGPGEAYNFGRPIPETEASIAPVPMAVVYDPLRLTATIQFRIGQNADADATLDPQHVAFRFRGTDTYGNVMDASADEYTGFSGIF